MHEHCKICSKICEKICKNCALAIKFCDVFCKTQLFLNNLDLAWQYSFNKSGTSE